MHGLTMKIMKKILYIFPFYLLTDFDETSNTALWIREAITFQLTAL